MKLIAFIMFTMSFAIHGSTLKKELTAQVTKEHVYRIYDYKTARKFLFGKLHLENGKVKDVYCEQTFGAEHGVGHMKIPNHKFINCEHTHPRSRFNNNKPFKEQLGDLHHLYPSVSPVNSSRLNHEFGTPVKDVRVICGKSKKGKNAKGNTVFSPPDSHKGNVARAKFYFSIRYEKPLSDDEEKTLRKWHKLDPVDEQERRRNEMIRDIQGNLNPFIEYPALVEKVKKF